MTRKDFIATANIVSTIKDKDLRNQIALDFSLYFKEQNSRFNTHKFLEACNKIKD